MTSYSFALVGAPNCGKTVLFNALTGARAKVANYPGVTVDKREGYFTEDTDCVIIDLPGTYSLNVTSPDEAVTRDLLTGCYQSQKLPSPDAIIAVADATNLRMTLRMVLELRALDIPMVVSLNLSDVAKSRGLSIDAGKLSEKLGVQVVETTATNTQGTAALKAALQRLPKKKNQQTPEALSAKVDALNSEQLYAEVEAILKEVVHTPVQLPNWHKNIDKIILHPIWGMMILLLVLLMVFQAVYSWAVPLQEFFADNIESFGSWVEQALPAGVLNNLLVNGVIAGVGSVLEFVPQIAILFAFILILEDSGYLPRAACLLDNTMSKTGLSGRAFIPLLSSFACAIPAVMSARTIQDPRERLVTIAIAPLLTCSARLPIYALIIAAIIPDLTVWGIFNLQGLTLFALYLISVISAALIAYIMKHLSTRKGSIQQFPLLMELPTFRVPNFKHIVLSLWDRISAFLKRAGTVILAISVVLWFLVSYPEAPIDGVLPAIEYSYAGTIGRWIEPIFAPIGFTWEMCIAMIPGFAAREVVVAALGTVYSVSADSEDAVQQALIPLIHARWSLATAFSFLAWYVYAPMCMATLAVIRRETKSMKQTLAITAYLFAMAYVFAFAVYHLTTWAMS